MQEIWVQSLGPEDPLEEGRAWLLTPVFLPGKPHGQRSLACCTPWGRKESRHDWSDGAGTYTPSSPDSIGISGAGGGAGQGKPSWGGSTWTESSEVGGESPRPWGRVSTPEAERLGGLKSSCSGRCSRDVRGFQLSQGLWTKLANPPGAVTPKADA